MYIYQRYRQIKRVLLFFWNTQYIASFREVFNLLMSSIVAEYIHIFCLCWECH